MEIIQILHVPVMLKEVIEMLRLKEGGIYVDATVGTGGHAEVILRSVRRCTLIGIDRDEEAIKIVRERLKGYNVHLFRDNFSNMKAIVVGDSSQKGSGYKGVDGILLDLGVSSLQLKTERRGFSFLKDEPLNMRMDTRQRLSAEEVVNKYPEEDLARILWQYGEERLSRKIARAIVDARKKKPISSCRELAGIIEKAVGLPRFAGRGRGRIHPATKTFQALRIEVNRELEELEMAINAGVSILRKGGRFCVLSYHSLEDRIVKNSFRRMAREGLLNIITKKPLLPGIEEVSSNPSSRSARLRVAEKL